MDITDANIEQIRTLLAEMPRRLAYLTSGLDNARLHTSPDQDAWSAHAILAHLRSCADVWGKAF